MRLQKRVSLLLTVAILLSLVTLSGCSSGGTTSLTPGKDTVVILQGVDANFLDPHQSSNSTDGNIEMHIFQQLTQFDDKLSLQPGLADSWQVTDAAKLTWQFKLKKNVTFSDGEKLDAKAVKWNFDRVKKIYDDKGQGPAFVMNMLGLDRVDVVDDYTVNIITKSPNPLVPLYVAHRALSMISPKAYEGKSLQDAARIAVGTGPYVLKEWLTDERIVLVRRKDYWDKAKLPAFKTIVWRPVPEAATRVAELKSGSADIIANVPPETQGINLATVQGLRRVFVGMRQDKHPALQDKLVRQAFNYGVDIDSILKQLVGPTAKRSAGFINPPYNNPNLVPYPYDPAKAAQLLDQAGWKLNAATGIREKGGKPLKLVFDSPNGRYLRDKEIAQAIAGDLKKLGVDVEINVLEWSVFSGMTSSRGKGLHDLFLLGSGAGYSEQGDHNLILKSDGSNRSLWWIQSVEDLYAKLVPEFDLKKRAEYSFEMENIVREEAPYIFIWFQVDYYGVSPTLDWQPRADENILLFNATRKK